MSVKQLEIQIEQSTATTSTAPVQQAVVFSVAKSSPYDEKLSPKELYNYLAPCGSPFSLYNDPFAFLHYINPLAGRNAGYYWFNERERMRNYPAEELRLLSFLSQNKLATKKQILRVVYSDHDELPVSSRHFIRKCVDKGILVSFSWKSSCKFKNPEDERIKPLCYGLSLYGKKACESIFQNKLPEHFAFNPVDFNSLNATPPKMMNFYKALVLNELYSHLTASDRLISWQRNPSLSFSGITSYSPDVKFEVIKDLGTIYTFWVEAFRLTPTWRERIIATVKNLAVALNEVKDMEAPERVILVFDVESRIEETIKFMLTIMDEEKIRKYIRFTTDELLLNGLNENTLLAFDGEKLVRSGIRFLYEKQSGVSASKYFKLIQQTSENEFEDE